jgi:hypothetical protein
MITQRKFLRPVLARPAMRVIGYMPLFIRLASNLVRIIIVVVDNPHILAINSLPRPISGSLLNVNLYFKEL